MLHETNVRCTHVHAIHRSGLSVRPTPLWAQWHWVQPSELPQRCRDVRPFRPRHSVYLQHCRDMAGSTPVTCWMIFIRKIRRKIVNSSTWKSRCWMKFWDSLWGGVVVMMHQHAWFCFGEWWGTSRSQLELEVLLFMRGDQFFKSTISPTESLWISFPRKSNMLMLRCTLTPTTSQTKCWDHSASSLLSGIHQKAWRRVVNHLRGTLQSSWGPTAAPFSKVD